MKNILVAVDLDDYTSAFIDYAVKIAKPFDAKIWLLHIADAEPDFVGYQEGPQYVRDMLANELRREHRHLQDIAKEIKKEGLEAEGLMVQGPTIEMILQEAGELKVDLILTATHRRSFIYRAFFGSVSTELFEKSKIPLLAYPVEESED